MDDFDIYADLPSINLEEIENPDHKKKSKEENEKLEKEINELKSKLKKLEGLNIQLQVNFSSLFKTAKAEITRKDRAISDLREQVNNLTFRRNQRGRRFQQNSEAINVNGQNQVVDQYSQPPPYKSFIYQNNANLYPPLNLKTQAYDSQQYQQSDNCVIVENVNDRAENSISKKAKNELNNLSDESDDELINKSQYRSTVYGERLRKRIMDEAETERRKKEEQIEKRKQEEIQKKEEEKTKKAEEEKKKKEEQIEKRKQEEIQKKEEEKTKKAEEVKKKKEEEEENRKRDDKMKEEKKKESESKQKIQSLDTINNKENLEHLQLTENRNKVENENVNNDKTLETISNHIFNNKNNSNTISSQYNSNSKNYNNSVSNKDDRRRYYNNCDRHTTVPTIENSKHYKYDKHKNYYEKYNDHKNSNHEKSVYKDRNSSTDKYRDYKEGSHHHKSRHKERSSSSDRCKGKSMRKHKKSKDKYHSPKKEKSYRKEKDHKEADYAEKYKKHKDKVKTPKRKRRSKSEDRASHTSKKRKTDTEKLIDFKSNHVLSIENREINSEKGNKYNNEQNENHTECTKEIVELIKKEEQTKTFELNENFENKVKKISINNVEEICTLKNGMIQKQKLNSVNAENDHKVANNTSNVENVTEVCDKITNNNFELGEIEDGEIIDSPETSLQIETIDLEIKQSNINSKTQCSNTTKSENDNEKQKQIHEHSTECMLVGHNTENKLVYSSDLLKSENTNGIVTENTMNTEVAMECEIIKLSDSLSQNKQVNCAEKEILMNSQEDMKIINRNTAEQEILHDEYNEKGYKSIEQNVHNNIINSSNLGLVEQHQDNDENKNPFSSEVVTINSNTKTDEKLSNDDKTCNLINQKIIQNEMDNLIETSTKVNCTNDLTTENMLNHEICTTNMNEIVIEQDVHVQDPIGAHNESVEQNRNSEYIDNSNMKNEVNTKMSMDTINERTQEKNINIEKNNEKYEKSSDQHIIDPEIIKTDANDNETVNTFNNSKEQTSPILKMEHRKIEIETLHNSEEKIESEKKKTSILNFLFTRKSPNHSSDFNAFDENVVQNLSEKSIINKNSSEFENIKINTLPKKVSAEDLNENDKSCSNSNGTKNKMDIDKEEELLIKKVKIENCPNKFKEEAIQKEQSIQRSNENITTNKKFFNSSVDSKIEHKNDTINDNLKKVIEKFNLPKNAKNIIIVKRRRKPVQLSDSPPVLVVDRRNSNKLK